MSSVILDNYEDADPLLLEMSKLATERSLAFTPSRVILVAPKESVVLPA